MKKTHYKGNSDEDLVSCAIGLSMRKLNSSPCPSDEDMADLTLDELSKNKKNEMLDHITKCERCYQIFLLNKDTVEEGIKVAPLTPWYRAKTIYAMAASFFIIIMLGYLYTQLQTHELIMEAKIITLSEEKEIQRYLTMNSGLEIIDKDKIRKILNGLDLKQDPELIAMARIDMETGYTKSLGNYAKKAEVEFVDDPDDRRRKILKITLY